ncbi:engulfment and cell motility protein 1-like isoform X2 [Acanthaster planci]|uniref:Engulfment and cell motility protein 1-like isoform X2 n=1 Tax=Acanthaster planci TaxID=133434 RepID=A0A8B7XT41_ACAPL|nr:engulfment and cell motility protein 1-like isoform X2 [Acanthaster planci]
MMTSVTLIDTSRADPSIIRLAVEMEGKIGQLYCWDQNKSLTTIVEEVCQMYNIGNPGDYALQHTDDKLTYITEDNRSDLTNGIVLKLTDSPGKTAQDVFGTLQSESPEDIQRALQRLSKASADITFAQEFCSRGGGELLIGMVEEGSEQGESLAYTLASFLELMEHSIIPWENITNKFIKRIASYVNRTHSAVLQPGDSTVTLKALAILESLVLSSADLYNTIANELTFPNLVPHLESNKHPVIQQYCLALMNALCLRAPEDRKKKLEDALSSKEIRTVIMEKIVRSQTVGTEMQHQLYVFQQLTFNLLEKKMNTKIDPNNEKHRENIIDLRRIAFGTDSDARKPGVSSVINDYKKLGFTNISNPTMDFMIVPPGILALDCMYYFATTHNESYSKVVLENSCRADEHECPFARTSIALTKILCEILKVGEAPTETGQDYYPMFFSCDNAFKEFFCQCIRLFNKTWKEMRAELEDFPKVMSVVKEQIERALKSHSPSMDQFWSKLLHFDYSQILKLRQQERSDKEEWNSQATPVVELREEIKPEIMELIKQQRLNYLMKGTQFNKYNKSGRAKDKFWYCRLTPNHKVLHYGDIDENTVPAAETLPNKLPVSEIQDVLVGKDCPHVKQIRGNVTSAFSILQHLPEQHLDFVAPNQEAFDMWYDGINALLGKAMVSKQTEEDLEMLLSMEIKMRLLDTANVPIPSEPPPIPPPPPDYNFYYDSL